MQSLQWLLEVTSCAVSCRALLLQLPALQPDHVHPPHGVFVLFIVHTGLISIVLSNVSSQGCLLAISALIEQRCEALACLYTSVSGQFLC